MKISLGTTYYNNPQQIEQFVETHLDYVDEMIIVDDGSQIYPLTNFIRPTNKLKVYRVLKDYGFNSHGCRNLIMSVAENDWVILMDSDRVMVYPELAISIIKRSKLEKNIRYRFWVHVMKLKNHLHKSVNDYLIHKDHFFSVGGYDEELIGVRTGDREFFEQLLNTGSEKVLHGVDIIFTRKPTFRLNDSNLISDNDRLESDSDTKLIYDRIQKPDPNKPILTFDWEQVIDSHLDQT